MTCKQSGGVESRRHGRGDLSASRAPKSCSATGGWRDRPGRCEIAEPAKRWRISKGRKDRSGALASGDGDKMERAAEGPFGLMRRSPLSRRVCGARRSGSKGCPLLEPGEKGSCNANSTAAHELTPQSGHQRISRPAHAVGAPHSRRVSRSRPKSSRGVAIRERGPTAPSRGRSGN